MKDLLIKSALLIFILSSSAGCTTQKDMIYDAGKYQLFNNRIIQDGYTARAISATKIISDYKSPANLFKNAAISFKFSINGEDNEMKSGTDHHFICISNAGNCETPIIEFGSQLNQTSGRQQYLAPDTKLTIRVDMRKVLNDFKTKGYYTSFNGKKIYKEDFKGVYVAGSAAPLIWDFDNLVHHPELQLHDEDADGIYQITLNMNQSGQSNATAASWELSRDLSALPAVHSPYLLADALYNLSLEEMQKAVEPDSTFRTGKEWAGVWTRDISYSIILAMASLEPEVARKSLLKKVNNRKRIIQDTGTGGAWPVSSDRMIWAVAAWELYKVTGDREWLEQAYTIIKNSIDDDRQNIYDPETGLVKGESSFLDWREQTYPEWMEPADIAISECLGTNAVHFEANIVLSKMAVELGKQEEASLYRQLASQIKQGINKYLWLEEKGYYGQYLYGRNYKIVSPRSEALGEALCVLFGIAGKDQAKRIISNTPVVNYGISCIYPQIPDIPPYHNNAIWPFVQSYWLWASVAADNERSVMESIAAIYRPAALFLTNKENFVASNGDYLGTQINSSNMLWSLSGNISIVHKVFFGIQYESNGIRFTPYVPLALKGSRTLKGLKYRNAMLDIEMEGYGNSIKSFSIDGKEQDKATVPGNIEGIHFVKITLSNQPFPDAEINRMADVTSPATPGLQYKDGSLQWQQVTGAKSYQLLKNGKLLTNTNGNAFAVKNEAYAAYQLIAVDEKGLQSFASEPLVLLPDDQDMELQAEDFAPAAKLPFKGFTGKGFIEVSTTTNLQVNIPVIIKEEGWYAIDFRYANGNGPANTDNKCAIRTLYADGKASGTILLPQRGQDAWSDWGYSNAVKLFLQKGIHQIVLSYDTVNENMNQAVNQAMLDAVRIRKISE